MLLIFHWPYISVPTGCGDFLRFWEYGACVSCPSGEAGQECLCWNTALLPQCRMPESNEVWKNTHCKSTSLDEHSSCNKCMFVRALGGVHVCQQLKMLSRKPVKSVSSWAKLWDPPYWSERRRQESGGMRMRRMKAEARVERPFLSFPVHPQSPPLHGCLCPSASETKAGKNSEDVCRWLMKPKSELSQF